MNLIDLDPLRGQLGKFTLCLYGELLGRSSSSNANIATDFERLALETR